jgi:hypothetical protein
MNAAFDPRFSGRDSASMASRRARGTNPEARRLAVLRALYVAQTEKVVRASVRPVAS